MRRGDGVRVRLSRIKGETPRQLLTAPFWFPAVVGSIDFDEQALHTEYDTVSGGRFSQAGRAHATLTKAQKRSRTRLDEAPFFRTLTLEVMVMDYDMPFMVEQGVRVFEFDRHVRSLLRGHRAFEFLMALDLRDNPELHMFATMRSITRSLREGEADTRYFNIAFSEWRDPSIGRRTAGDGRKHGVHLPAAHKLRLHDTLHTLSHEYYGTYEGWRQIAAENGVHVGQSYELVKLRRYKVGSKITIPKVTFSSPPGEPRSAKIPVQEFAPIAGE